MKVGAAYTQLMVAARMFGKVKSCSYHTPDMHSLWIGSAVHMVTTCYDGTLRYILHTMGAPVLFTFLGKMRSSVLFGRYVV